MDYKAKYAESQRRVAKLERAITEILLWLRFPEQHMLGAIRARLKRAISKGVTLG